MMEQAKKWHEEFVAKEKAEKEAKAKAVAQQKEKAPGVAGAPGASEPGAQTEVDKA